MAFEKPDAVEAINNKWMQMNRSRYQWTRNREQSKPLPLLLRSRR
jgi:hypothetical protein